MIGSITSTMYDRTSITSGIAQKLFKKLDTSGDGGIDETELSAISGSGATTDISQLFSKMDSNSDGKIDADETESVLQKLSAKMEAVFSSAAGAGQMKPPPGSPPSPDEMFSMADADGSGGIDETEFANITKNGDGNGPQFSDLDTDSDGVINETENAAAFEKMGPPKGPPPGPPPSGDTQATAASMSASSVTNASLSKSNSFSDLLSALQETLNDDEDEASSSIQQLFTELKNSIKYSAQGTSAMNYSGSLFSMQA
ncbi:MAG TPA: EF-hand domain-containing protein [Chitinispirillaceae bacterium]|nr:EF-hand domain-containing protein [Chitinispirillaceae bacterium]